jgi:hypothetical protein
MALTDIPELVKGVGKFVSPQTEAEVKRHRVYVSLFIMAFALHVLWACGYFTRWGLTGFSTVEQITTVQAAVDNVKTTITTVLTSHGDQLKDIQRQALEKNLVVAKQNECEATKKRYFAQRLIELNNQYITLTGHDFHDMPACEDLK